MSSNFSWVVLPIGIGVAISALVEILKRIRISGEPLIPDGQAGRLVLTLNILVTAALTMAVESFGFEMEGEQAQAVFEFLGALGQMIIAFLGSYGTFRLGRETGVLSERK